MGFFGGLITFIAVLVQLVVALVVGFVFGAGAVIVAVEEQCPAAWELMKESMSKKKLKEDHVDAGDC